MTAANDDLRPDDVIDDASTDDVVPDAPTDAPVLDDLRPVDSPLAQLDRPLARTLRFEALTARPRSAQMAWLQEGLATGRYGAGQRAAIRRRTTSPRAMGLWIGGLFAVFFLITTIVMLLQGDMESAGIGVWATLVVFVVAGGLGYLGGAVALRNRWRRHTQVALFAEANGLDFRPAPSREAVPPAVRARSRKGKGKSSGEHADLVAGWVQRRQVLAGTRLTTVTEHESTSVWRLVWAGVAVDASRPERSTAWRGFDARCRDLAPNREILVYRHDGWVVVGVEDRRGSLDVVPDLFAMLDLALAIDDGEPV